MSPTPEAFSITTFSNDHHRSEVIDLWNSVFGYEAAHNEPGLAIDKKIEVGDGLFFVAISDGVVVGTVMAGYDGHRGWIYSLAVAPEERNRGTGSRLVELVENELTSLGCLKVNLQIMEGNEQVQSLYETLGYKVENRVSMGKRLHDSR